MSSVVVKGGATGAGVITLAAPVTNTNRTITLPDATDTLQTVGGVLSQFNASGSAPVYACRAWVNFNGTGTVAIRASGNVSSITDNGVGSYTVNFTTAMPDANYSVTGMASDVGGTGNIGVVSLYTGVAAPAVGSFRIFTFAGTTQTDNAYIYCSAFR